MYIIFSFLKMLTARLRRLLLKFSSLSLFQYTACCSVLSAIFTWFPLLKIKQVNKHSPRQAVIHKGNKQCTMHKKFNGWVKNRRCISLTVFLPPPHAMKDINRCWWPTYILILSQIMWLCKSHQQQQDLQLLLRVCSSSRGALPTEAGLEPRQLNQSTQGLCHSLRKLTAANSSLQNKVTVRIFVSVANDDYCIQRCTNGSCLFPESGVTPRRQE